jgi:hypothetical protein
MADDRRKPGAPLFRDRWNLNPKSPSAPAAAGNPVTMVTDHQQHIFYRDNRGIINHVVADDRPAAGDPVTMVTDHQQHIFYRDSLGIINHVIADDRRKPNAPLFHDVWNLNPRSPEAPAAAGDPVTMLTEHQQHLFYRDRRGSLQHVMFDDRSNPGTALFHDIWNDKAQTPATAGNPVTLLTAPYDDRNVLTLRNNNQRTGASKWPGLNPSSSEKDRFGILGKIDVDGAVLAQPLFMESVQFVYGPPSDAVFVATAKNNIYAFEVHSPFRKRWSVLWDRRPSSRRISD